MAFRRAKGDRNIVHAITASQIGQKIHRAIEYFAEFKVATNCCNDYCYEGHAKTTFLIAFSPDGSRVASSQGDHTIKIFDMKTGKLLSSLPGHSRSAWTLCFHPYLNNIIASGSLAGEISIWDLNTGSSNSFNIVTGQAIASLSFHPEDDVIAVATAFKLYFVNWKTGDIICTSATESAQEPIRFVRFGLYSNWILTGVLNNLEKRELLGDISIQRNSEPGMQNVQTTVSYHRLGGQRTCAATTPNASTETEAVDARNNATTPSAATRSPTPAENLIPHSYVNINENNLTSQSTSSQRVSDDDEDVNDSTRLLRRTTYSQNDELIGTRMREISDSVETRTEERDPGSVDTRPREKGPAFVDTNTIEKSSCSVNKRKGERDSDSVVTRTKEKGSNLVDTRTSKEVSNAVGTKTKERSSRFGATDARERGSDSADTRNGEDASYAVGTRTIERGSHSDATDSRERGSDSVDTRTSADGSYAFGTRTRERDSHSDATDKRERGSDSVDTRSSEGGAYAMDTRTSEREPDEGSVGRIRATEESPGRPFRSEIWSVELGQRGADIEAAVRSTRSFQMQSRGSVPVYSFLSYPAGEANASMSYGQARNHAVATATARTPRHVHTAVVVAGSIPDDSEAALRTAINRAIAGVFAGNGEGAVASNIVNTTYRLQLWSLQDHKTPLLKKSWKNVIVPSCKLHNDGSIDVSQDECLLAAYIPSVKGFPEKGNVCVFSLQRQSLGQCIFSRSYGPNSICLSFSPLNTYLLVGLAARRISASSSTNKVIGQILRLSESDSNVLDDAKEVITLLHPKSELICPFSSVNTARFHPTPGVGVIYGTTRGTVRHCRFGNSVSKSIK